MRKFSCWYWLPIVMAACVCQWTAGCKTTGYTIRIETGSIKYSEVPKIEAMLIERGYKLIYKEKRRHESSLPHDVSTFFEKRFTDKSGKGEWWKYIVYVGLFYVKDTTNNLAQHLDVHIYNHHVALIVPEIKTEIDNIGDLIYQEIVEQVEEENVKIKREEWGPPRFL